MSRVDKEAFERAMRGTVGAPGMDLEKSYTSLMTIETGCQVTGCARPDIALSFVCNKHAQHIEKHKEGT